MHWHLEIFRNPKVMLQISFLKIDCVNKRGIGLAGVPMLRKHLSTALVIPRCYARALGSSFQLDTCSRVSLFCASSAKADLPSEATRSVLYSYFLFTASNVAMRAGAALD